MKSQARKFCWLGTAVFLVLVGTARVQAQVGTLSIEGECPGDMTVRIDGGIPNSPFWLLHGAHLGRFQIPLGYICGGEWLGIRGRVTTIQIVFLDENGNATLSGRVQEAACGRHLLAIRTTNCETTNVLQIP